MPKKYFFYVKNDSKQEPISSILAFSRLQAAKQFASRKQLDLKTFLKLWHLLASSPLRWGRRLYCQFWKVTPRLAGKYNSYR